MQPLRTQDIGYMLHVTEENIGVLLTLISNSMLYYFATPSKNILLDAKTPFFFIFALHGVSNWQGHNNNDLCFIKSVFLHEEF